MSKRKCVSVGSNARTLSHILVQNMEITAEVNLAVHFQPFLHLRDSGNHIFEFAKGNSE